VRGNPRSRLRLRNFQTTGRIKRCEHVWLNARQRFARLKDGTWTARWQAPASSEGPAGERGVATVRYPWSTSTAGRWRSLPSKKKGRGWRKVGRRCSPALQNRKGKSPRENNLVGGSIAKAVTRLPRSAGRQGLSPLGKKGTKKTSTSKSGSTLGPRNGRGKRQKVAQASLGLAGVTERRR